MIAINHAITGALIGLTVGGPVALPIAFLSHFALDAIPHFGDADKRIKNTSFIVQLLIDATLCGILVLLLFISLASSAWIPALCAFLATSPDFMWMPDYLRIKQGKKPIGKTNFAMKFHSSIQWFQRPIGGLVEAAWLICGVILLAKIL